MGLIRDSPLLIGDTGPFCRFAETGALDSFLTYLGDKLVIVREVEAELNYRSEQPAHKELRPYREREPPYVGSEAIDLDTATQNNVRIIADRWAERDRKKGKPDRGPHANVGEIATVMAAEQRGLSILMDDGDGKKLADAKHLTVYTTEDLLIEMVAEDAIKRRRALHIYERVYGKEEAAFDAAITARQAQD